MKFAAGLLVGLALAVPIRLGQQPTSAHLPDAVERMVIAQPTVWLPEPDLDVEYGEIEGQEQCLIDWMEAEVGPGWDAVTVITYLDRAWAEFDGPCHAWEELR